VIVKNPPSMFIRRIIKTTSDYISCMRQSYTELAPLLALVGVVLTAGEGIVMWILTSIAPALAQELEKTDRRMRMLVFGALPAAIIFVWGIMASGWLMLWRQNRE
jgi:Kef-type K+ transport system membrane component KefB